MSAVGKFSTFSEGASKINTIGAAKGLGVLAVIAIIIVVVFAISKSLGVSFSDIFGGDSTSDEAVKDLQVETKDQLVDQVDANRDLILAAEAETSEQIKRAIEREAAETEAILSNKIDKAIASIENRILEERLADQRIEDLRLAKDIFERVSNGVRVAQWELEFLNNRLKAGAIVIDSAGKVRIGFS